MVQDLQHVRLAQIYPPWSRFLPVSVLGLLFPPLARLYAILFVKTSKIQHLQTSISYSFAALATTSTKHPRLPHYQQRLAQSLHTRFRLLHDQKDLQLAYMLQVSAVKAVPPTHPDLHWHRGNLQATYRDRYQTWGRLEDLEAEIALEKETIAVISSASTVRPRWLQDLAFAHHLRYRRLGLSDDLETQLTSSLSALELSPEDDPDRPARMQAIAIAYSDKYTQDNDNLHMDLALFWSHSSISTTPSTQRTQLGVRQQALSTFYCARYRVLRNLDDLLTAIEIGHEVLQNLPNTFHELAPCYYHLAFCYGLKNERFGDAEDLAKAIEWGHKAVKQSPESGPNYGIFAGELAKSYFSMYDKTGDLDDLESSVRWAEVAVIKIGDGHAKTASYKHLLSVMIFLRYRRHRNRRDLDRAFIYSNSAIAVAPKTHPDLPEFQEHLALMYRDLFGLTNDIRDLEKALEIGEAAISATQPTHPKAPERYRNFAGLHSQLYRHKGGFEHRETTMKWSRAAVDASAPDDPNMRTYLYSLSLQYFNKYTRLKEVEDLEESLKLGKEAIKLTPPDHPRISSYYQIVAEAYAEQFYLLRQDEDRRLALQHFEQAMLSSNSAPSVLWGIMLRWASFSENLKSPDCIKAYGSAYHILPELFWLGSEMKSRHETLVKYEVSEVSSKAIAACIKYGELERAIEFLEQSLALTFNQLLDLQTDLSELKDQFPGYASILEKVSEELQKVAGASTNDEGADWDKQRKLAMERSALLKTIRELPGFQDFLLPAPFQSLSCAADYGPVIVVNCSGKACDAIILLPGGRLVHVNLSSVKIQDVAKQSATLRAALGTYGIHSRGVEPEAGIETPIDEEEVSTERAVRRTRANPSTVINDVLTWSWTAIVLPIFSALEENGIAGGRVWWCLTGPITYLPLHAAGPHNAYIQSYTSTLGALIRARSASTMPQSANIIAVGLSEIKDSRISHLPNVKVEIEAVEEVVGQNRITVFMNEYATLERIESLLPKSSWLHLACHGQQGNAQSPLKSGLLLYDGTKLELEKIINTSIPNATFVFLSACETAMGDVDMTSESLHLAGGMIFAGFKAVVGTVWSINDLDGPVVAKAVYSHVFREETGELDVMLTGEALHLAVQGLRDRGVPPHRWVPFIHIGI